MNACEQTRTGDWSNDAAYAAPAGPFPNGSDHARGGHYGAREVYRENWTTRVTCGLMMSVRVRRSTVVPSAATEWYVAGSPRM
jgi:hypothetical protein